MDQQGINYVAIYGAILSTVLAILQGYDRYRKRRVVDVSIEHNSVKLHYEDGVIDDYVVKATITNKSESDVAIACANFTFVKKDGCRVFGLEGYGVNEQIAYPVVIRAMNCHKFYFFFRHASQALDNKDSSPSEMAMIFEHTVVGKKKKCVRIDGIDRKFFDGPRQEGVQNNL